MDCLTPTMWRRPTTYVQRTTCSGLLPGRVVSCYFLSGPFHRPDGISAFLSHFGWDSDTIDNHRAYGGGEGHNLLKDSVYQRLLQRCAAGEYAVVVASP
eukprot:3277276-Pleurochrysis_carterae.AAC.1